MYDSDNGIFVREDTRATRWADDSYREGLPHVENGDSHHNEDGAWHHGYAGGARW
jgi:hypothetical protein